MFAKLEEPLRRKLIPVGCAAHIVHNALSTAVMNVLPIDIENTLVKIYYHFRIYTKRMQKYHEFCEFIGCEAQSILSHSQTRWLSIFPCIERLLQVYDALKCFFLSEKNVPLALYNFFSNNESYFCWLFLHPQLQLFHDHLTKIQSRDLTALEVAGIYYKLMRRVEDRMNAEFVPFTALQELRKNVPLLGENRVKAVARNLYFSLHQYMSIWSSRLVDYKEMEVLLLNMEVSVEKLNELSVKYVKGTISDNALFDTCVALNRILKNHMNEKGWGEKTLKQRWEMVYRHFLKTSTNFGFLQEIVETILVLPGTNSETERLFSQINRYWDTEKSQLQVPTLESVMKVKNLDFTCEQFYEYIKGDTALLLKFRSSEKYN